MVALIPARRKSKRILDKNIKELAGHPLIAYTVRAAIESGVFKEVIVSSDSPEFLKVAEKYGAKTIDRPPALAQDTSTDYGWACHALFNYEGEWDAFAVLRPTNPFRTAQTIQRAYRQFQDGKYPSLRAVEKCRQHPHKMWRYLEDKSGMLPILSAKGLYHNMSYQSLTDVYVQNGCMDMSRVEVLKTGGITGERIQPFFTEDYEGFDLNAPEDWILAEELIKRGMVKLPEVKI